MILAQEPSRGTAVYIDGGMGQMEIAGHLRRGRRHVLAPSLGTRGGPSTALAMAHLLAAQGRVASRRGPESLHTQQDARSLGENKRTIQVQQHLTLNRDSLVSTHLLGRC